MSRWFHTRHALGMLILILLTAQTARSQSYYARSETNTANGLCIGCWVQNPANAVDTGVYSTYGTMRLTVTVLNAYVSQKLIFTQTAKSGTDVNIVMESANATLLNATVLGGLEVTSYINGSSNADTKGAASITINVLAGSATKSTVTIHMSKPFNAVELKLKAGIASALTNLRVYSAWFSGVPLPVKLVSFDGYSDGGANMLRWSTASEINNEAFDIERSDDGKDYATIATIAGAGTTNEYVDYSYQDAQPVVPLSYYRLRQRDYDGKSELSPVIAVTSDILHASPLRVINDPITQSLSVSYNAVHDGAAAIDIYDMTGQQAGGKTTDCNQGMNQYSLSDLILPAGQYLLRFTQGGASHVQKLIRLQ